MMLKNSIRTASVFLPVVILITLTACSTRLIDFTVISSKQTEMRVKEVGRGDRMTGQHGVYWFIFVPMGKPNLKEAVDRAIEQGGRGYDALIDGVIYYKSIWYVLTGYSGYKVEGTPIKTSEFEAALLRQGKDPELAMQNVLYHSALGISNDTTIARIGMIEVNDLDDAERGASGQQNGL